MKVRNYPYFFLFSGLFYALAGMGLGLYQHLSKDFSYIPLHSHVNSLGWLSLAVIGVMYHIFPQLALSRLAPWQFWTAQIGTFTMLGGLVLVYADASRIPIYIGTVLVPLSFLLLLVMFAKHGRSGK